MEDRIKKIRKAYNLTQEEFAKRLGLSRNHIAQVETGKGSFSDRTISDICRIFSINENWLRSGEGEMQKELSREAEIGAFLADVFEDGDDFRMSFISALAKLDVNDWKRISEFIGLIKKG